MFAATPRGQKSSSRASISDWLALPLSAPRGTLSMLDATAAGLASWEMRASGEAHLCKPQASRIDQTLPGHLDGLLL
jgi:hypothetical protein